MSTRHTKLKEKAMLELCQSIVSMIRLQAEGANADVNSLQQANDLEQKLNAVKHAMEL